MCFCSTENMPVFHLSYERKDLALLVTVSNRNGDDAYEAKLVGNFPNVLSYSGFRSPTVRGISATDYTPVKPCGCHAVLPAMIADALSSSAD